MPSVLMSANQPSVETRHAPVTVIRRVATPLDAMNRAERTHIDQAYVTGMDGAFKALCASFSREAGSLSNGRNVLGQALNDRASIILVADDLSGAPVGFAVARPATSGLFSLVAMGVNRNLRRQGIGTRLLKGMLDDVYMAGARNLDVSTPVSATFFKAHGAVVTAETEQPSYEFGNQTHIPLHRGVTVTTLRFNVGA